MMYDEMYVTVWPGEWEKLDLMEVVFELADGELGRGELAPLGYSL